ncbi:carbohydrate ABC transporter permease [Paenibacillus alginolyticus]|uniref:Carbohydrate ABC transporter permease n=1 Tax=Paenibacillus alginolyticus TaxID=59839 RepID=A0ABT4GMJ8_9BACL|nr:carbohydrate ABC transporter permease [Paenibacillus alginolyticus]MCY9663444.1 carbohydrate ABC transporter permease [Paenibacillus alginolyticus]MCY9697407.1 carbohydrate ABC transporter permease [Paenibacillus alginolyticus]MEC0146256.1 carbohydrate ABC transporter permease [Paenibacillus alginolyticus]
MKIKRTPGEIAFDTVNALLLLLFCAAVAIPLMNVIAGSLSSNEAIIHAKVALWPVGFNLHNYDFVIRNAVFWKSFGVTIQIVVIGTAINMILTILTSYPLSKGWLGGRKVILLFIIFTMIFQAPMVPMYILVKSLGLLNSIWSLIIPGALSAFNMMLCITFMRSLPEELFEAARVDGMSEYRIVWRIVAPLSMPINVTLILFYAVGHWNNYLGPLLYITDRNLQPLQLYLYKLISQFDMDSAGGQSVLELSTSITPQGLQMATIVIATIPIIVIYPFLQKHFIKGALLGSVKE